MATCETTRLLQLEEDVESGSVEEVPAGQPGAFARGYSQRDQIVKILKIFAFWPVSCAVYFLLIPLQLLSRLLYRCGGNEWFTFPGQNCLVHASMVHGNAVKETWLGWLLCCGCVVKREPVALLNTALLPHPPAYIFDEDASTPVLVPFQNYVEKKKASWPRGSGRYRSVDGGGNSERYPFMGQGLRGWGASFPKQILTVLPDPYEVTRAVLSRKTFRPASNGISSTVVWFANIVIHDFFRTAKGDDNKYVGGVDKPWVNLHSSYVDLQVLYGFNEDLMRSVRTFEGGKIHKFAETRLNRNRLTESIAVLELFLREHNYVCDELAKRYPELKDSDEKLFQTARLITAAIFAGCIQRMFTDMIYLEFRFDGKPIVDVRGKYGVERDGSLTTFAFNLLYRWHSGLPEYFDIFRKEPPPIDTDADLKKLFTEMIATPAGGHGPQHVPAGLVDRPVASEAKAILDGRLMGVPRLNDYRRTRLNMRPYTDFLDLTKDPELAAELQKFYPTVDDVELVVGVQCEACLNSGWCLPDTIAWTLVADAANVVVQDRFYTDDYTDEIYTPWGLAHAKETNLADLFNSHFDMRLDRNLPVSRVPGFSPVQWSDMQGSVWNLNDGFDRNGQQLLVSSK